MVEPTAHNGTDVGSTPTKLTKKPGVQGSFTGCYYRRHKK